MDGYDSGNNAGQTLTQSDESLGESATEYQIKASPIDGLTVGASYMTFSGGGDAGTVQLTTKVSYMATYSSGPFSVGYSKGFKAPVVGDIVAASDIETVELYDQTNMSVAYAATDDLSISYEKESVQEANYVLNTTADVEQESTSVQAAYTMGGMTLQLSIQATITMATDGAEQDQTLFAVTMAF